MAYTTINKHTDYFNTLLWQGNGNNARALTGVGFQPDFTWIKDRTDAESHCLTDAVRGATKSLRSNGNNVEATDTDALQSFNSDGFTVGNQGQVNKSNGDYYVGWNWKANGSGSANTDGSINSTVSLNSTSGFSIVSYTGTQSAGTVGHGLGVIPSAIIVKSLASQDAWYVWFKGFSGTEALFLDTTSAKGSHASYWNSTTPTSSVYSVLNNTGTNNSAGMIAYCFAEKKGYSKVGSYKGNASTDGTFIYTGFKPAWVMIKNADAAEQWRIYDSKREPSNQMFKCIFPNANNGENTTDNASEEIDFVSNGIKIRSSSQQLNGNNQQLMYMAFAEEPLVANVGASIPATAR